MNDKIILLVEDNPDDEAMALFALNRNRVADEVVVARDGHEALDYLFAAGEFKERDPHIIPELVLLDIKLPTIDGIEVLRQIRKNEITSMVPVVMLTTSDEEQDRLRSYQLHANSFIRKPINFDRFVEIIDSIERYWLLVNEPPPQEH